MQPADKPTKDGKKPKATATKAQVGEEETKEPTRKGAEALEPTNKELNSTSNSTQKAGGISQAQDHINPVKSLAPPGIQVNTPYGPCILVVVMSMSPIMHDHHLAAFCVGVKTYILGLVLTIQIRLQGMDAYVCNFGRLVAIFNTKE